MGAGVALAAITGADLSTFSVTDACAVLPARSVADLVITWPAPSVVTSTGAGHETPDPLSLQVNVTRTSVRCQPSALATGLGVATIVARVLSMFTVTLVVASLPARSTAVPVNVCCPSVVTAIGAGQAAIPESASAQVNVIVASEAIQPSAFGAGEIAAVMVGAVLSTDTVAVAAALFPAMSTAAPVTD